MSVPLPTLYIFAGLPGSGKSTIAQMLASKMGCGYLRIDTVEQGLRDFCSVDVYGEGYQLSYQIAVDTLKIGNSVVADSCNPIDLTRNQWMEIAKANKCQAMNIEVMCSDKVEHRQRVESRVSEVPGLKLPTWDQVENREYHSWEQDRIVIDTAGVTPEVSFQQLTAQLK